MRHCDLVDKAVWWLRARYRCGVVLSEQVCANGEAPDAIGWKGKCRSVLVECKLTRADFLADRTKPFRSRPELGIGCERYYFTPRALIAVDELPKGWGLLEYHAHDMCIIKRSARNLRSPEGFMSEMNLLLASLRRVEVRIEPQTITDFLKWKNRLADYNGGALPQGLIAATDEQNVHLSMLR